MNAGTMYFKIVIRKMSSQDTQFILLAGATSKLSHTTADYVETLSPASVLTQPEIDRCVAKLMKVGSYGEAKSVTMPDVVRKLEKLFEVEAPVEDAPDSPSLTAL